LATKKRGIAGKTAGETANCRHLRANNRCNPTASPPDRQEAAEIGSSKSETAATWRRQKRKKSLQWSLLPPQWGGKARKCRENVRLPPDQLEELDWLAGNQMFEPKMQKSRALGNAGPNPKSPCYFAAKISQLAVTVRSGFEHQQQEIVQREFESYMHALERVSAATKEFSAEILAARAETGRKKLRIS